MQNEAVGRRILLRRTQLNLTLDDIANEIGVARSTIQRYEKGTIQKLKLPVIEAIARALMVDPAWLYCKTDDMCPATLSHLQTGLPSADHLDADLIQRLADLTPEELQKVDAFIQGLRANR